MPFKVSYLKSFERDIKSFKKNKPAKKIIQQSVLELLDNPHLGSPLNRNIDRFWRHRFSEKPEFRIIYVIYDCCPVDLNRPEYCRFDDVESLTEGVKCEGLIEFAFVRTREDCNNLYKQSREYFENYLREK